MQFYAARMALRAHLSFDERAVLTAREEEFKAVEDHGEETFHTVILPVLVPLLGVGSLVQITNFMILF